MGTGRLVVVSNRLPVTIRRTGRGLEHVRSSGGLVSAFEPTLNHRGGLWIGWPGSDFRSPKRLSSPEDPYQLAPVRITNAELKGYYHGFSNRTLWPLFHTMPTRAGFQRQDWSSYERINDRFAEVTASATRGQDLIWVNDYHLMLTPWGLRRRAPRRKIGFFLHIPFPPYDVYRVLPWSAQLLKGLLASDLIGFHIGGYVRNFLEAVEQSLDARVDRRRGLVSFGKRTTRVVALPIGIDYEHYDSLARDAPIAHRAQGERVVLGVDRLDYTKGIPQRIYAFARLLDVYPEHRQKTTLLQVAVPSRAEVAEYRDLKREIDELVGRVNGRFGTAAWTPIRYLYRTVTPDRLAGFYRDADVAFITPLRDGMNLVAKEFVACQVNEAGVLVLSDMAGAAETMKEALLVNPYDIDGTADTLNRALIMGKAERQSRMQALRQHERTANVHVWAKKFLKRLAAESG